MEIVITVKICLFWHGIQQFNKIAYAWHDHVLRIEFCSRVFSDFHGPIVALLYKKKYKKNFKTVRQITVKFIMNQLPFAPSLGL